MSTTQTAQQVAAHLVAGGYTTRIWTGGSAIRVYAKWQGKDAGYIEVAADGSLEGNGGRSDTMWREARSIETKIKAGELLPVAGDATAHDRLYNEGKDGYNPYR